MNRSTRQPSLAEVIRRFINARLDELHTCLPGVVTAWDPSTQRASVKPLIKHAYYDEDDNRQVESIPVLTGVPVQFLGAGGFRLTCPISDGSNGLGDATTGTLFFSEASLDAWLSGQGQEVDPGVDHRFHLSDAIFIPGLNPFGSAFSHVPGSGDAQATLGADDGPQIHLRGDKITIGDEGISSLLVARDTDLAKLGTLEIFVPPVMGPTFATVTFTSNDYVDGTSGIKFSVEVMIAAAPTILQIGSDKYTEGSPFDHTGDLLAKITATAKQAYAS